MILSPAFRGPEFEIFQRQKRRQLCLVTFKPQNGDLKYILKFWEKNPLDHIMSHHVIITQQVNLGKSVASFVW
jgi:hypothetical protein